MSFLDAGLETCCFCDISCSVNLRRHQRDRRKCQTSIASAQHPALASSQTSPGRHTHTHAHTLSHNPTDKPHSYCTNTSHRILRLTASCAKPSSDLWQSPKALSTVFTSTATISCKVRTHPDCQAVTLFTQHTQLHDQESICIVCINRRGRKSEELF